MEAAAEPMFDGANGDPKLVVDALAKAEVAFRAAESTVPLISTQRLYLRSRLQVLVARAWYRYPNERQAFMTAFANLRWLEDFVGGAMELEDIIGRPPNPAGEQAVAILGIYPAALRRADFAPAQYAEFRDRGLRLVEAYLRLDRGGVRAIYDRTHACACQWFYLGVHELEDDDLVKELYRLDRETRPQVVRGEATCQARDMEFARRFGDPVVAEKHRLAAIADFARYRLVRHQQMAARYGYLAA
jgi:hypothetical protein